MNKFLDWLNEYVGPLILLMLAVFLIVGYLVSPVSSRCCR